uniref:Uncharacterized protein n=1 Tax=Rhizophagus irregularis (strain DAOM 181602 / DAOM 197198 / MUCL 43194) TaxID=747089 RepID=U9URP9_RHIID
MGNIHTECHNCLSSIRTAKMNSKILVLEGVHMSLQVMKRILNDLVPYKMSNLQDTLVILKNFYFRIIIQNEVELCWITFAIFLMWPLHLFGNVLQDHNGTDEAVRLLPMLFVGIAMDYFDLFILVHNVLKIEETHSTHLYLYIFSSIQ